MARLPILTNELYIKNKDIDYRLYIALLEISNFDGEKIQSKRHWGEDWRYLYKNKLDEHKEQIMETLGIEESSYYKKLNKLKKANILIYEQIGFKIVLRLRVKYDSKEYQILNEKEIQKLKTLSSNAIKTYLILKYTGEQEEYKQIQLIWLSDKLGLSKKNTSTIKKYVEQLKELGLINLYTKNNICEKLDKNNVPKIMNVTEYFFKTGIFCRASGTNL